MSELRARSGGVLKGGGRVRQHGSGRVVGFQLAPMGCSLRVGRLGAGASCMHDACSATLRLLNEALAEAWPHGAADLKKPGAKIRKVQTFFLAGWLIGWV